jgi:hypothetical protein
MKNITSELIQLNQFLSANEQLETKAYDFNQTRTQENNGLPFLTGDKSHFFYRHYHSGKLNWALKDADEYDLRLSGSVYMLPAERMMSDWKGIVYFDADPDSALKSFMPVDLFSEDACAGIFKDDSEHQMQLYLYEGQPINLHLSVDDYLLMALRCRGFYFWQYLILSFIDGGQNEVVQDYKGFCNRMKYMYTMDELKLQYDQLKKI